MNLLKLFEMQAALDTHIEHEHPNVADRLEKKILALLVELGELAQNWRGFKFWSNDQEPRVHVKNDCNSCGGLGFEEIIEFECEECKGYGFTEYYNPLLEEYVDCLHFALSIGLDIDFNINTDFNIVSYGNTLRAFNETFLAVSSFYEGPNRSMYRFLVKELLNLGTHLGFTQEQIEQAYIKKNEVNHQRQLSGY